MARDNRLFVAVCLGRHREGGDPAVSVLTRKSKHSRSVACHPQLDPAGLRFPGQSQPADSLGHPARVEQSCQRIQELFCVCHRPVIRIAKGHDVLSLARADTQVEAPLAKVLERERGARDISWAAADRVGNTDAIWNRCGPPECSAKAEWVIECGGAVVEAGRRSLAPEAAMSQPAARIVGPYR